MEIANQTLLMVIELLLAENILFIEIDQTMPINTNMSVILIIWEI